MVSVLAYLLLILVLVTVHEFGHYWVAKRCGVRVLRFAIGLGKPIWIKKFGKDQTEFALCPLPLGGYVKMLDERESPVDPTEIHRAFNHRPVWQRMLIVLAGPAANFVLAGVLYAGLLAYGVPDIKAQMGDVAPDTPAAAAGLQRDDLILSVNGREIEGWDSWRQAVLIGMVDRDTLTLLVRRASGVLETLRLPLTGQAVIALDAGAVERLGISPYAIHPVFERIAPGSLAERAGFKDGDQIAQINDMPIHNGSEVVTAIRHAAGRTLVLSVLRGGQTLEIKVTPDAVAVAGGAPVGKIGVAMQYDFERFKHLEITRKPTLIGAIAAGAHQTWDMAHLTLKALWRMALGEVSWRNLSGPAGTAVAAGEAASFGWQAFINLLAILSVALGVMNLLPIPVLDGGHFMYYVIEVVKGSPLSVATLTRAQYVGGALILLLISFALYNDIHRFLLPA